MNFDRSLIGYRSIYGWTRLDIFNGPAERGRRIASASTSVRLTAWTGSLVMDRRAQGHKPAYNRRVSRLRRGCQVKFILIKLEDPEIERSFFHHFPMFLGHFPIGKQVVFPFCIRCSALRKRLTQDAPAEAAGIDPADSKPPKVAAHHGGLVIILGIWRFPKIGGSPKPSVLIGLPITNHPFWGTPISGNSHIWVYNDLAATSLESW